MKEFDSEHRVLDIHGLGMILAQPYAIVRGLALFARHVGVVAGATRSGSANVCGDPKIDFASAVGVGADSGAAARGVRTEPASSFRDLELGLLRELVSVLLCHRARVVGHAAHEPERHGPNIPFCCAGPNSENGAPSELAFRKYAIQLLPICFQNLIFEIRPKQKTP